MEAVIEKIKSIIGDHQTYLTFDIDCLDPAFAPGTGTPVSGGLSSAQALGILRGLKGINMVGGDVVEVSPPYDTTGATAIAGAHVAMELMCLYCANVSARRRGLAPLVRCVNDDIAHTSHDNEPIAPNQGQPIRHSE